MSQETNDLPAIDAEQPKLPTGLNVLTILTFIGCGIFGLLTLATPMLSNFFMKMMDDAARSGKEFSQKELADMAEAKAAIELSNQHMVPLMIIGMAGIILCLLGAIWMRKFKKDGYWLYVAGELTPTIAGFAIMGTAQFTGVSSYIFGIVIPVLFVILYTMQRKYLVK